MQGATPIRAGIALLPLSLAFFAVSSVATGPLQERLGAWVLVAAGTLLAAAGLSWCAGQARATPGSFGPALLVAGVGIGLFTGPISHEAVARAPADRAGVASGLVNTVRCPSSWSSSRSQISLRRGSPSVCRQLQ